MEPEGNGLPQDAPPQEPTEPQEPQTPTEPQEPQEPVEPEDFTGLSPEEIIEKAVHKTQSWQGRQNKSLLEEVAKMMNEHTAKMQGMLSAQPQMGMQPQFGNQYQQPQQAQEPQPPDPMSDTYQEDLVRFLEARDTFKANQARTAQMQTENQYRQALAQQSHPDPKIHEAVLREIVHDQNVDQTGMPLGPFADAQLNYSKALQSVLMKQLGSAPNPLQNNEPPKPGMGVSQPSEPSSQKAPSMPKNLDEDTQKLLGHLQSPDVGWGADKAREVLGRK